MQHGFATGHGFNVMRNRIAMKVAVIHPCDETRTIAFDYHTRKPAKFRIVNIFNIDLAHTTMIASPSQIFPINSSMSRNSCDTKSGVGFHSSESHATLFEPSIQPLQSGHESTDHRKPLLSVHLIQIRAYAKSWIMRSVSRLSSSQDMHTGNTCPSDWPLWVYQSCSVPCGNERGSQFQ